MSKGLWVMSLVLTQVTRDESGAAVHVGAFPGCVIERSGPDKDALLAWRDGDHGKDRVVTGQSLSWHEDAWRS